MAKLLFSIWCYLLITGLLTGAAHNAHHTRCGTSGPVEITYGNLLWPVALGAALTIDRSMYKMSKCTKE